MTDLELMQIALDALKDIHPGNMTPMAEESWNKAIEAICAALSNPNQKREWRGLTTAETKVLWNLTKKPREYAQMIDAKLRERNT